MKLTRHHLLSSCLLLLCLASGLSQALPDDRNQPIHIKADRALHTGQTGKTVYQGNVRLTQGSIQILADKITIVQKNGKADLVIAQGSPAELQQQPTPGKPPVTAQGLKIRYYLQDEALQLIDQAFLSQEGQSMSASRIDYNVRTATAEAVSSQAPPQNATGEEQPQQIHIVIPPKKQTTAGDTAPAPDAN